MVENIGLDHREQDLDYLKKIPMLRDQSLADPYFGQPGKVDLLLEVVHTT